MNKKELRILQSELDSFSDRALRWSNNLQINMGSTYDIEGGSEAARKMESIEAEIRKASACFSRAARVVAEILEGK